MLGEAGAIVGGRWFLIVVLFCAAILMCAKRSWKVVVLFFLIGGIGYANGYVLRQQEQYAEDVSGRTGSVAGRIYEIKDVASGKQAFLTVTEIKGVNEEGQQTEYHGRTKVIAHVEAGEMHLGQTVVISGSLKCPEPASNPGGFRADLYYGSKGIFLTVLSGEVLDAGTDTSFLLTGLAWIRERASDILTQTLSPADASVLKAMLLGEKADLDPDIKKMYQINGIAHILAISGLHIAILGMSLFEFLRKRLGSYAISGSVSLVVVVCYGIMTGLSGSTCRAVIMMALLIGSKVIGRTTDMLTSAGIACVMMAVANPYVIEDAGFQLSFGAVAGIAVIKPALDRIFGAGGRFQQSLFVSASSSMATFPIVIYYYYQFPLYGILLNLVVVPLVSTVLMSGIVTAVCGLISLKLAMIPAVPASCILRLYRLLCSLMEMIPGYTINVGHITVDMIAVYYAGVLILLYAMMQRRQRMMHEQTEHNGIRKIRYRVLIFVAVIFAGISVFYEALALDRGSVVCYLDVGQGDGILIRTESGTHILIDGGSTSNEQVGEYVLLSAIRYYRMADLDYVFVTHGDADHVSGIKYLLETEHTGIRIRHLVVASHGDASGLAELTALAKEKGVTVLSVDVGDEIAEQGETSDDSVVMRCISPSADLNATDANNASLVLEMEMQAYRFLFMGDVGEETEAQLVSGEVLRDCDVLKVGHHGSKYASTAAFLDAVSPEYAVISCSKTNRYGHPAKETLTRLSDVSADVHCTMNEGAVIVKPENGALLIQGFR